VDVPFDARLRRAAVWLAPNEDDLGAMASVLLVQ
jgi:hypothetical protein